MSAEQHIVIALVDGIFLMVMMVVDKIFET